MSRVCQKRRYRSREQAVVANSRTSRRYGEMEPYFHEACGWWHLGHAIGSWSVA